MSDLCLEILACIMYNCCLRVPCDHWWWPRSHDKFLRKATHQGHGPAAHTNRISSPAPTTPRDISSLAVSELGHEFKGSYSRSQRLARMGREMIDSFRRSDVSCPNLVKMIGRTSYSSLRITHYYVLNTRKDTTLLRAMTVSSPNSSSSSLQPQLSPLK